MEPIDRTTAAAPNFPALLVEESIAVYCTPGSEDNSACIDRLLRRQSLISSQDRNTVSMAPIHRIASDATGRVVLEDDVSSRVHKVEEARAVLKRLLMDPGIPQRTPEWYDARGTMITASDFGQALGISKFGTRRDFLEKKCGYAPQKPFDASIPPLRWGIMFEPVACALYSALNVNVHVHEFGLLRHPSLTFLGASPDGVTEDGVMLEIKCPWRRRIDGTVPQQYYMQIQGQLAVTGLDECDYFEVEFEQLRNDFEITNEFESPRGNSTLRGAFIERQGTIADEPPSYEYPPPYTADSDAPTQLEHIKAFLAENIKSSDPDHDHDNDHDDADTNDRDDSCNAKVIWWRVRKHATIRVRADPEFSTSMLSSLETAWTEVLDLRKDKDLYDRRLAEMAAASRSRSNASSSRGKSSPPKGNTCCASFSRNSVAIPSFVSGYAFIDDENDPLCV